MHIRGCLLFLRLLLGMGGENHLETEVELKLMLLCGEIWTLLRSLQALLMFSLSDSCVMHDMH